eukprot:scaffold1293_cov100-Skeletonema_marinoi.AAC.3
MVQIEGSDVSVSPGKGDCRPKKTQRGNSLTNLVTLVADEMNGDFGIKVRQLVLNSYVTSYKTCRWSSNLSKAVTNLGKLSERSPQSH